MRNEQIYKVSEVLSIIQGPCLITLKPSKCCLLLHLAHHEEKFSPMTISFYKKWVFLLHILVNICLTFGGKITLFCGILNISQLGIPSQIV